MIISVMNKTFPIYGAADVPVVGSKINLTLSTGQKKTINRTDFMVEWVSLEEHNTYDEAMEYAKEQAKIMEIATGIMKTMRQALELSDKLSETEKSNIIKEVYKNQHEIFKKIMTIIPIKR